MRAISQGPRDGGGAKERLQAAVKKVKCKATKGNITDFIWRVYGMFGRSFPHGARKSIRVGDLLQFVDASSCAEDAYALRKELMMISYAVAEDVDECQKARRIAPSDAAQRSTIVATPSTNAASELEDVMSTVGGVGQDAAGLAAGEEGARLAAAEPEMNRALDSRRVTPRWTGRLSRVAQLASGACAELHK